MKNKRFAHVYLTQTLLYQKGFVSANDGNISCKLNELEYINGKIYANIWQKNSILIVNPATGKVEGVANLNSLKTKIQQEQTLDDSDEVLNGIAFDKVNNRIFVTGKHWSKLYEIELIKK